MLPKTAALLLSVPPEVKMISSRFALKGRATTIRASFTRFSVRAPKAYAAAGLKNSSVMA